MTPRFRPPGSPVPLVLASASPRRRRLLAAGPWKFLVRPSGAAEPSRRRGERADRYVRRLALLKARAVARGVPEGLVLGADTVVVFRGKIFGKPASSGEAKRMLEALSGRWHRVYTGLALVARPGGRVWQGVWGTDVKVRRLKSASIVRHSHRHLDKAGAYAAQARGNPFVEKHRGPFDNVVGLPMAGVRVLLGKARSAGWRPAPR
ncbi:MAG TPA: nucleoside triphosphate pyrophosphatase [Elusimicrobiota bacterium]|nr:nucleoside triphosphate pyrophosphatase [Elusimicrobiota bacterium]HND65013.1 nucleoside triphosphate pyrophosphatase [Elusimicrobiota bacterium]